MSQALPQRVTDFHEAGIIRSVWKGLVYAEARCCDVAMKTFQAIMVALLVLRPFSVKAEETPVQAQEAYPGYPGLSVGVDLAIVRPVCLGLTCAGVGIFAATFPFTVGHSSWKAAKAWIGKPARWTFARPLGDWSEFKD